MLAVSNLNTDWGADSDQVLPPRRPSFVDMETRMLYLVLFVCFCEVTGFPDAQDASALRSLKDSWENLPPSWSESDDPCGNKWEGITCNNSRIISLKLSSMGVKGSLSGDLGALTALRTLDLSYNLELTGPLTPTIGNLKDLNILILLGCSFTGRIPAELGNLSELTYLALNSNNFTGEIPPSLGKLSKLYWLDLAENQLNGKIPVSPGLDELLKAKHFHLNKNQLSGTIPPQLFRSNMVLIHVLFDRNKLTGSIPPTLGLVQTLEVLRLNGNSLSGPVPESISNLTRINALHLENNKLTGPLPDLSGMSSLNYVDLSNNSFDSSEVPKWFSTLATMTTLVMESSGLEGQIPPILFSFPQIQQVKLSNNKLNGTLDFGERLSNHLQLIDLKFNNISAITIGSGTSKIKDSLELYGNPVCSQSNLQYCQLQQQAYTAYSTSLANCGSKQCPPDQNLNPQSCECAYAYEGTLYFRAPFFRDLSNSTRFHSLESSLWTKLDLPPGSVSLQNPFFNLDDYLLIQLELFPPSGKYFNRSEIQIIGFEMSNHTYKPPHEFGPFSFIASPYSFPDESGKSSMSLAVIIGIAVGCTVLVLVLIAVGVYAFQQKRRAERAIESSNPFASWGASRRDSGGAPQLKGARWFSYDELKNSTNNFSDSNQIGYGGYGKVYKGILPGAQLIAIKRAHQASMQGGHEFKTEIELLSRVHHKNLVGLLGFCFEQGEQMLVYEYMSNGTLRESLSGKSGIYLDWKRRLRITLGAARGLAYLHELAHPPIIHRDVKSTNILLDEYLTAKVADFGLSKLVSDSEKGHVSTQVKGTLGYLDPEYYMTQQLTEKSDVYSFGVVMLELISAKQPIERGKYIVREVQMMMNKNEDHYGLKDLMDPTIRNTPNLIGFGRFVELAMQCLGESAANRPTMSEVVKEIETILQCEGVNTSSTSASSSATDFGSTKGPSGPCHPYNEPLPEKDYESSGAFEYSGGYTLSEKVEPK